MARSSEMNRLRAALTHAAGGSAGAVLISGDAGVGKSRMLDELVAVARSEGAVVLLGRCSEAGDSGLPYLPFTEAIAGIAGLPDHSGLLPARPALGRLLPGLVGEQVLESEMEPVPRQMLAEGVGSAGTRTEPGMGKLQLFDAVHGLLTDLAEQGPVVLAIEDLHWADGSTRDLLSFLLARLRGQRLLVVTTYRSDDLHRKHPLRPLLAELFRLPAVERLDLAPFEPGDTLALVDALTDGGLPDRATRQIVQRSEGNPFFVEELVTAYDEAGERGLPWTLAEVLLAKLERLSPSTRQVLRAAAVAGRKVLSTRLAPVVGLSELDLEGALREAVQHGVLLPSDSEDAYVFRHALLGEAVYADLLPGERVRMHAAYAKQLAQDTSEANRLRTAAELAHHSLRSNDLPTALRASVEAANEADRVGAPAEALKHVEQALELWSGVPSPEQAGGHTELDLLSMARSFASNIGDRERAVSYARTAVKMADERRVPPEKAATVRRHLARALWVLDGREPEAAIVIKEAWSRVADREPSESKAWVLAVLALVSIFLEGNPELGTRQAEEAVEIARQVGLTSAEADALITLASIDVEAGRIEEGRERLIVARDKARETGVLSVELRAWSKLGLTSFDAGRAAEALEYFQIGTRRARETGLSASTSGIVLRSHVATARYTLGSWKDIDGVPGPNAAVADWSEARVTAAYLPLLVGRGDFDTARSLIAEILAVGHVDGWLDMVIGNSGAELELWRGDPERAMSYIDDALNSIYALFGGDGPPVEIRLGAHGVAAAADLAVRARRLRHSDDAAVAAASRFLTVARDSAAKEPALGPEGRAWLARAEAEASRVLDGGSGDGSPALWQSVVDEFAYGHPYGKAVAQWKLAASLFGADRREEGAAILRPAAETAYDLGARPLTRAIEQLASRARVRLDGASGPASGSASSVPAPTASSSAPLEALTPRELAVLREVAKGSTNREAGEALYISEKTVSVHLSRVMAKLDVRSRTEAVSAAYDRGLL